MEVIRPISYQEAQKAQADIDASNAQRRLVDYNLGLEQQNQGRAGTLRDIYAQGRRPTIEQIGAYNPESALSQQNNESLQQQRTFDMDAKRQEAVKGLMTQLLTVSEQAGFRRDKPSTYGIMEQFKPKFGEIMQSVTGRQLDLEKPIDVKSVLMLAGQTPFEKQQESIQGSVTQEQALQGVRMPYEQKKAELSDQYEIKKEDRGMGRFKQQEDYKLGVTQAKPLPPTMMKMVNEGVQTIGQTKGVKADVDSLIKSIDNKTLNFGPISNIYNKVANGLGISTEESRQFDTYNATIKSLQNTILNIAKGPQTDQDAVRAFETLVANPYDPENVKTQMTRITESLDRTAALQEDMVRLVYENSGKNTPNLSTFEQQKSTTAIDDNVPPDWTEEDEAEYQKTFGSTK